MNPLGMRARAATFARLFLAQATFNNRTMIGSGLAFCLVPVLRRVYHNDPDRLEAAMSRHVGLFNSHPYLTGMAVGAVARMEVEGAESNAVERFKTAIRGPLGSLGDQLIWATWLPAVALLTGGLGLLWVRPIYAVLGFLLIYNVGHLSLRLWALSAGLRSGPLVATQIRRANLPQWTARLGNLLTFSVGTMLGGLALMAGAGGQRATLVWGAVTVIGFGIGAQGGIAAWRITVTGFVTVVLGLAVAGMVS